MSLLRKEHDRRQHGICLVISGIIKKVKPAKRRASLFALIFSDLLFYFLNDSFERFRIVQCEVGQNLAVQVDVRCMNLTHERTVRHTVLVSGGIDTYNPKRTEITFLRFSIAIGVCQTLFIRVLRHCPDVPASAELTFGLF